MVLSAAGAVLIAMAKNHGRSSAHNVMRSAGIPVHVCCHGDDSSEQALDGRIGVLASDCVDDRNRHTGSARLDRNDASDALSFFVPCLARSNRSRNSRHDSRIPVVALGFGPRAAARTGVFLSLEPLVGMLLGVFIMDEGLGALGILGGALMLFAAAYFRRPRQLDR
jgi:hypothetical protein